MVIPLVSRFYVSEAPPIITLLRALLMFFSSSSGIFISASEDKTGILGFVEEKIARVTMLPRTHGEVGCDCLFHMLTHI